MNRKPGDRSRPDAARKPTTSWERALRPGGVSRGVLALLLVAVGVFLTLAWTALQDTRRSSQGRAATQTPAQTPPPVNGPVLDGWTAPPAAPPRTQRISKCTSRAGAASYSDAPCPSGTVESIVTVHPDANLADGLTAEARQASVRSNAAAAQNAAHHERQAALNSGRADAGTAAECAALDASIVVIDSAARQPRSAREQDRLRTERQQLRDRQFALRCA